MQSNRRSGGLAKRKGNQKPTASKFLPVRKSKYKEAVGLYNKSGRKAQKWQEILLKPLLAVNTQGLWVHTKFGYSLPRRNGKNEVVVIREIYGLVQGERGLHTAHRTTTSHSAWERLVRILEAIGYVQDQDFTTLKAKGAERVEFINSGGRVEFRTRTSTGGLGEGYDYLVIDEAQEYTDDQESALKYVVTDSKNPQTIFCGTPPTPISSGTVFLNFRKKVLEGGVKNAAWAEWGVEEQSNPRDVDLWYLTNPSLGTIFTERSVEDESGTDEIDFNIQRLGLWIKYNQKSAILPADWDPLKVSTIPAIKGKLFAGIKYGVDGENVALSIAVKTEDEKILVNSIDCQSVSNGNLWILGFLRKADIQAMAVDGANGQQILKDQMKENKIKPDAPLPTVKEIITANAMFEQAIFKKSLLHTGQPSHNSVVTNCEKRAIGSNGGFGYRAHFQEYDAALMDSVILAHWLCSIAKPPTKQKITY